MLRTLFVFLGTVVAALAAPTLKEKDGVLYFPTKVGDKLVYEDRTDGKVTESTLTIVGVEAKDGSFLVTTEVAPQDKTNGKVRVSGQGLSQVAYGAKDLATPTTLVRLPLKIGESWEVKEYGQIPKHTRKFVSEEEVEVPAGKFKAVRVDWKVTIGTETIQVSTWYAPSVGLVKQVIASGSEEQTRALKSFTPGK